MINAKKILILGLGNEILSDDGIGPRLVHDLSGMEIRSDIIFDIASCGGLELMEYITGYGKVILLDAIRTTNGIPGEVYSFKPADFKETLHLSNLHDINFLTALKLGNQLELELPGDLHIIAVEILEDKEFSEELTSPLKKEYPTILEEVYSLIETILKD
jgi:hydrogenase maturation protease